MFLQLALYLQSTGGVGSRLCSSFPYSVCPLATGREENHVLQGGGVMLYFQLRTVIILGG